MRESALGGGIHYPGRAGSQKVVVDLKNCTGSKKIQREPSGIRARLANFSLSNRLVPTVFELHIHCECLCLFELVGTGGL
jgi:hypothetical protein